MHSKYPWTVSLCTGGALQFLITDADGNIVFMGEMYQEDDLTALLSIFQRNPEIRVEEPQSFARAIQDRKFRRAEGYLESLPSKDQARLLKENNYDVIKAAAAGRAAKTVATGEGGRESS